MTISKIAHCCLLVKIGNLTILTDPGNYSAAQNSLTGIDAILVTHEHADHLHADSVKEILRNNPAAQVITNSGVGKQLGLAGIPFSLFEGRATGTVKTVSLEAFDCRHEEIYK
ncbi:MAG: MBL fold metallo-hydrolase [Patescibacteria group bacterium]|nr:MBL fold metallo-hydrolase [Patescibacteria group bacterium]